MRDQGRQLIAFHVRLVDGGGPGGFQLSELDQFVISEGDFEPSALDQFVISEGDFEPDAA